MQYTYHSLESVSLSLTLSLRWTSPRPDTGLLRIPCLHSHLWWLNAYHCQGPHWRQLISCTQVCLFAIDAPFFVQKRAFDAALLSSLIYVCESWFGADLQPISKLYNFCLEKPLGVRIYTCNDVCYVEIGYPSFQDLVKNRQHKFFHPLWQGRSGHRDDPLAFVINLVQQSETRTARTMREFLREDVKPLTEVMLGTVDELRRIVIHQGEWLINY